MQVSAEFFEHEWRAIASLWPKYCARFAEQTRAATEWLGELVNARPGMHVLDLASGIGEPALELARRVGSGGAVVATDLIAGPLELLAERAANEGLSERIETRVAPMQALPFAAASFDAVTCRLGLMFSPDVPATLREVLRVLRPDGVAAFVVWGDPRQPLFASTLGVLSGELPASPHVPGPFRFSGRGALLQLTAAAGFADATEHERRLPWPWPGDAASCWEAFLALAGPGLRSAVSAAAQAAGRDLEAEIVAKLRRHERQGITDPGADLIAVVGRPVGDARTPARRTVDPRRGHRSPHRRARAPGRGAGS